MKLYRPEIEYGNRSSKRANEVLLAVQLRATYFWQNDNKTPEKRDSVLFCNACNTKSPLKSPNSIRKSTTLVRHLRTAMFIERVKSNSPAPPDYAL